MHCTAIRLAGKCIMFDQGFFLSWQAVRRQLAAMPNDLYLVRLIHQTTQRACELVAGDGVVGLLLPAMTLLMETILRMVERKYGKARRVWVFDRGIVSEENLAAIRKCGGQYLVGTPRSQMKQFEADLSKDDWTRVRPEVDVEKEGERRGRRGEEKNILARARKGGESFCKQKTAYEITR